jgi:lipopolysaccharide transport system ATP-binding protein
MSDVIIRAENLGKKYRISHQEQRQGYTALRDVLAEKGGAWLRKPWAVFNRNRNRPVLGIAHPMMAAPALGRRNGSAFAGQRPGGKTEDFWALQDVSFEIKRGDVVGIIGRNGAGKSTLLKILSRITEPTVGRVHLDGRVASLLEVGTGFHPELTGRENIFLNGAILGMTKKEIESKFDEIVAFAEIERFLDTPVKRYSSGMYVRLAFAVAAYLEPEILVVDEVLAVGDADFQKKCLGKMESVARQQGRTVLFVSHNMAAVRSLCRAGFLLEKGKLIFMGGVEEVTDRYLQQAVVSQEYALDTGSLKRPSFIEDRARITRLEINGGAGLKHGEPARFDLWFESKGDFSDVAFAVTFSSREGTRIMSVDSDIPGERLNLKRGSRGKVSLGIDTVYLAPDTYLLGAGIRSGDNHMLDYLPGCMHVTVLPGERTPAVIAMRTSGQGGVRYPCRTEVDANHL